MKNRSGHGDATKRKLSKKQIDDIKSGKPIFITVYGKRKKVTKSNVWGGAVYYYKRSDGSIALRRIKVDGQRHSMYKGGSWRRGFEHD